MKLLLVTREYPPYVKGGMCRVAEYLVRGAQAHGIDVTLIANHPGGGRFVERTNTITIYRVPSLGSTFLTQLPSFGYHASVLVRKLQQDFDVIYSNYTPLFGKFKKPLVAGFQATRFGEYIACKESAKPVYALLNRLYIPLDKALIQKADAIIALSEEMVQEIRVMGGEGKKVCIIPNGVDHKMFSSSGARNFASHPKKILYVGRLDSRKGLDTLLAAVRQIQHKIDTRLTIVGDGRDRHSLIQTAKSLSLPVDFLGPIAHELLPEIYHHADLFVLPSLYEGLPLSALEAMACGTPTILSDGSPDLGVPRFKKGSVDDLAKCLFDILSSHKRLEVMSQRGLRLVTKYDWKHIVGHLFDYLRQIC